MGLGVKNESWQRAHLEAAGSNGAAEVSRAPLKPAKSAQATGLRPPIDSVARGSSENLAKPTAPAPTPAHPEHVVSSVERESLTIRPLIGGLRVVGLGGGEAAPAPGAVALGRYAGLGPVLRGGDQVQLDGLLRDSLAQLKRADEQRRQLGAGNLKSNPPAAGPMYESFAGSPSAYLMGTTGRDFENDYVLQMARIGAREGFAVAVMATPEDFARLTKLAQSEGLQNLVLAEVPDARVWTEDFMHVRQDGSMVLPPVLTAGSAGVGEAKPGEAHSPLERLAVATQLVDRIRRANPSATVELPTTEVGIQALMRAYPEHAFAFQFAGNEGASPILGAAFARALGGQYEFGLAYVEGGNVVVGQNNHGELRALVGADTVAMTTALLPGGVDVAANRDKALDAIAHDLGVARSALQIIEQPGDFHLDMAMAFWEPGVVLLNDAREAFKLQREALTAAHAAKRPKVPAQGANAAALATYKVETQQWLQAGRTLEQHLAAMKSQSELRARGETRAASDLEQLGYHVVRVPARFVDPSDPTVDAMNFMNGEAGTSRAGGRYFITTGGEPWAELAFLSAVARVTSEPVRLYFGPSAASTAASLREGGSLNCRAKPLP